MDAAEITVRRLSPAGGAEVIGIDARAELDDGVKRRLRAAWDEYALLLLRGQELTLDEQRRFGEIFGRISNQGENAKNTGGVTFVSNVVPEGVNPFGELTFHVDHSFYPTPLRGIMLYGIEVPPEGGDTKFANAKLAYRLLPEALRIRLEGLTALHVYDFAYGKTKYGDRIREADIAPDAPRAVHPVAFTHPETGEKILYVSRRHTDRIIELPEAQSEALLDELLEYLYRPEIIFVQKWKPGDLVIWDNLALQHARTDFDRAYKRHMRRIQIA